MPANNPWEGVLKRSNSSSKFGIDNNFLQDFRDPKKKNNYAF